MRQDPDEHDGIAKALGGLLLEPEVEVDMLAPICVAPNLHEDLMLLEAVGTVYS